MLSASICNLNFSPLYLGVIISIHLHVQYMDHLRNLTGDSFMCTMLARNQGLTVGCVYPPISWGGLNTTSGLHALHLNSGESTYTANRLHVAWFQDPSDPLLPSNMVNTCRFDSASLPGKL